MKHPRPFFLLCIMPLCGLFMGIGLGTLVKKLTEPEKDSGRKGCRYGVGTAHYDKEKHENTITK